MICFIPNTVYLRENLYIWEAASYTTIWGKRWLKVILKDSSSLNNNKTICIKLTIYRPSRIKSLIFLGESEYVRLLGSRSPIKTRVCRRASLNTQHVKPWSSSRRPPLLLLAKNRKLRLLTWIHQNWTTEDCKNVWISAVMFRVKMRCKQHESYFGSMV